MTPLQKAVIDNDAAVVKKLIDCGEGGSPLDQCGDGFNALELAKFLGADACMEALGILRPASFLIKKRGASKLEAISKEAFEQMFNITYRPSLYFASYSSLQNIIKTRPYILRSRRIAFENYALTEKYLPELSKGGAVAVSIRWVNEEKEYGLFAEKDLTKGEFVGEYAGLVRRIKRLAPNLNAYCLHYPTRFWSIEYTVIDALHDGNLMRFINHGDTPNLRPLCLVDRGLLRMVFVAAGNIPKGAELLFDYGPDFWERRQKEKNPIKKP